MLKTIYNAVTTPLPAPVSFNATLNTLAKSGERTADGKLKRETLPNKWSIQLEWTFETPEQAYTLFNHLVSLSRVFFDVEFPAPTGVITTAKFYTSPISANMLNYSRGAAGWWRSIKINFLEV